MENPEKDPEEGKGDFKRKLTIGVIIVAVIAAVMVPTLLLTKSEPSNGGSVVTLEAVNDNVLTLQEWKEVTGVTLASLWSSIDSLEGTINGVASPKDWTSEVNAIKADITALQASFDALEFTDWSGAIVVLQDQIDALQDDIDNLVTGWSSNTSMVTRIEGEYVDIMVPGAGDYPVIVTLYGESIGTVQARHPSIYNVEISWAAGDMAFLAVEPIDEWEAGDIIELKAINGTVDYAVAVVGKAQEGEGTSW